MHYFFRKHEYNGYVSYSGHSSNNDASEVITLFAGYDLSGAIRMMKHYK